MDEALEKQVEKVLPENMNNQMEEIIDNEIKEKNKFEKEEEEEEDNNNLNKSFKINNTYSLNQKIMNQ